MSGGSSGFGIIILNVSGEESYFENVVVVIKNYGQPHTKK